MAESKSKMNARLAELLEHADIDALCRAMWGEWWWWESDCDNDPPHRASQESRKLDRKRMRNFLANLDHGKRP